MGFRAAVHQFSRLLHEPRRIRRLHYSKILAWLHQASEGSEQSLLASLFGISEEEFSALEHDLTQDRKFRELLEERFYEGRGKRIRLFGERAECDYHPTMRIIYYCARLSQPSIAVETGVLDGFSTAAILKALRDNDKGRLVSIDLPARRVVSESSDKMLFGHLPSDRDPGWLIPDDLRQRWELRMGSSRDLLEPLLEELGTIDYFLHDSLHTAEHMMWEYVTAWSVMSEPGLLMSDDVFWNHSFRRFSRRVGVRPELFRGLGILPKTDRRHLFRPSLSRRPEPRSRSSDRETSRETADTLAIKEAWQRSGAEGAG